MKNDENIINEDANEIKDNNIKSEVLEDDVTFIESTEDGQALPTKDIIKKLREEIKTLRKEKEEYLTGWQRAKADYINLQKEHGDSHVKNSVLVKEKFMGNIIPAFDSFDMAFSNKENWGKVDKNWRMGVEYIYSQFMKGLEDGGVERIDQIGVKFDPTIHESMEMVKTNDESKDHTVEKIIQTGYRIGHRIIRPAKVNVFEFKKE